MKSHRKAVSTEKSLIHELETGTKKAKIIKKIFKILVRLPIVITWKKSIVENSPE